MTRPLLLLAAGLAVAACHSSGPSAVGQDPPAAARSKVADTTSVDASGERHAAPDGGYAGALSLLSVSNNALGLDVYGAVRRGHPNLAISPLSVSMALTMAWAGARGDTAVQMKRVLHVEGSVESTLDAEAALLSWVRDPAQTVTLRVANRLFGEKTYAFEPAFLQQTNAAFGAALEPLDFAGAPDESRRTINDWIATLTDQRIKDLIPAGGVTNKTRLLLANAIYLLGLWEHPFRAEETKPAAFHASAASASDVPTMHETEQLLFVHTDGVKVLQVPYQGGQFAMAFVLPDAVDGLDAVESRLSPSTLATWVGALASARVRVALPKFKIDPAEPLSLNGALASLGMPLAFDRGRADFTGIASAPGPAAASTSAPCSTRRS